MTTQYVTLPQSFFAKAKREYQDWRQAFFREVLQNSIDAGATDICFNIRQHSDTSAVITVTDNGCGMDRVVCVETLQKMKILGAEYSRIVMRNKIQLRDI
jgi:3-isopropylmalate dehydratase small subunit